MTKAGTICLPFLRTVQVNAQLRMTDTYVTLFPSILSSALLIWRPVKKGIVFAAVETEISYRGYVKWMYLP